MFLDNLKNIYKSIFSISIIWFSSLLNGIIVFSTNILLAKYIGIEEFGYFYSIITFAIIAGSIAGFGAPGFLLNIFSSEGIIAVKWISVLVKYIFITSFFSIILFLFSSFFLSLELKFYYIIFFSFNVLSFISTDICVAKFQLKNDSLSIARWQLFSSFYKFLSILILFFLLNNYNTILILFIFSFISLLHFILSIKQLLSIRSPLFKSNFNIPKKKFFLRKNLTIENIFRKTWLYGFISLFYLVYTQSNIILTKYFFGDREAGLYAIAFTFLLPIFLIPSVVYQKYFLPKFMFWSHNNMNKLIVNHYKINSVMIPVSLLILTGVWIVFPFIINLIFSSEYLYLKKLLLILSMCIPFRFASAGWAALFSSGTYVISLFKIMFFAVILNFTANIMLIPVFGLFGAAYAAILTEFMICLLFYINYKIYFK